MRPLEIAALTASIVNFFVTALVLSTNFRARTTPAFLIWGLSLTMWNLGVFLKFGPGPLMLWLEVIALGVIFLPISLLHLSLGIVGREHPRAIGALYLAHVLLAIGVPAGWFIRGATHYPFGPMAQPGPLYRVFLGFFVAENIAVLLTLYRAQKAAVGLRRSQLRLLFTAFIGLCVLGSNDFLPVLGFDHFPGTTIPFVPLGNLAAILFGLIIAYNLLQHQFLDVRLSMNRGAAQAVRLLFVSLTAFALLLLCVIVLPRQAFPVSAAVASLFVIVTTLVLASVAFPRFFGKGEDRLERRIMGDRFEYQDQVREFIESMTLYGDLEVLLENLHDILTRTFRISSYWLILRDEASRVLSLVRAHPDEAERALPELRAPSPVFEFFENGREPYLAVNPNYVRAGGRQVETLARAQLAGFPADFCFPLTSQNEPFGLLLVGPKQHAAAYTPADVALLAALAKNLSLMVNQIRLKTQIAHTQELDLLGRMSKGMAHDLNNLLTPISTLLQLAREQASPAFDDELLPVALRNLRSIQAYIREALFFSQNLRPEFQIARLDLAVAHAAEVAKASRGKLVEVVADTPGEVPVEMNEVLIQRLFANLISNAIDASPEHATVRVTLQRIAAGGDGRDWLRVRVADTGEGISRENLDRVLKPYFTTKDRGDETRGFGLGLAICRKIVNLHGGNL